jgi:hypothetical protein
MDRGRLSRTYQQHIFDGCQPVSAGRIGRDALLDWLSVAAIPTRDWALAAEPSIGAVAVGIAFHQWADFSWALVFFGVFGRWTGTRGPAWLAVAAVPWAILTSSLEWPVLAADLHVTAALLDRLSGPSLVGIHVPAIPVAPSLVFGASGIQRTDIPSNMELGRHCRNLAPRDFCALRRLRSRAALDRSGSDHRPDLRPAYVDPS